MPDPHDASLRAEWHRYYSPKRSALQHMQLELLGRIPARRVLEIGPYLGYVTALLDNAGYAVETLDFGPRAFARPDVPHHDVDLTTLAPGTLTGFDAILCCETLEHIPWETAQATLRTLAATGSRFLIVSVPWSGADLTLSLHVTPHWLRAKLALKWPKSWRRFTPSSGLMEHHWEVGYRGNLARRLGAGARRRRLEDPRARLHDADPQRDASLRQHDPHPRDGTRRVLCPLSTETLSPTRNPSSLSWITAIVPPLSSWTMNSAATRPVIDRSNAPPATPPATAPAIPASRFDRQSPPMKLPATPPAAPPISVPVWPVPSTETGRIETMVPRSTAAAWFTSRLS